jgi:hypothetical protein
MTDFLARIMDQDLIGDMFVHHPQWIPSPSIDVQCILIHIVPREFGATLLLISLEHTDLYDHPSSPTCLLTGLIK